MAQDLLSLVDLLIGNVLGGNVFSNVRQYSDHLNADRNALYQQGTPPSINQQAKSISNLSTPTPTLPGKLDIMSREDLASKFDENKFGPSANQNSFTTADSIPQPVGLLNQAYRLGNQYTDDNKFSIPSYGLLRTLDIFAISNWMKNVGRQVYFGQSNNNDPITRRPDTGLPGETVAKSTAWLASQFLLASLNKGDPNSYGVANMIWNPLSFFATGTPGARGLSIAGVSPTGITIGATGIAGDYKTNVQVSAIAGLDRLLLIRQGAYSEVAPAHRLSKLRSPVATPGFFGDITKAGEGDTLEQENIPGVGGVSVLAQVDGGVLTQAASQLGLHTNPYNSENPYGPLNSIKPLRDLDDAADAQQQKLSALFHPTQFPGGVKINFGPNAYNFISKVNLFTDYVSAIDMADAPGLNAATTDAAFNPLDETFGVLDQVIPEDQIYMPFMFQDLRDKTEQFLYFRAFLKGDLTETFTPDWESSRYFGRVDEIPTYVGTSRILNFSFDVVAWSPKDLKVIYTKLQKLQSMVYPTYSQAGFMNSGPIVRIRIGDLIAGANNKGLPGYITSLDFAYDDGIWNIEENLKVPRKISVSISYTVLHDGNPGIYPYPAAKINADGSVESSSDQFTFGAGKFTRLADGSFLAKVSVNEIRKIFGSVKGIKS